MNKLLLIPAAVALSAFALTTATAADTSAASKQIDALVAKGLAKEKLKPNKPVTDETFLRRVYLDVTGRIPTQAETVAFLDSKDANKRAKLIDQLLASDGYVYHFYNYWADILRAQSTGIGDSSAAQEYLNFLRKSLRENKPYDQFVRELVGAEGTIFKTGAIGYYMRDRGMPLDNLATTIRVFLGTRIECAQCHNHPFDKWTEMDFYKMAAFSNGMAGTNYRSKNMEEANKLIREDKTADKECQDMMRRALTDAFRPLQSTEVVQNKISGACLPDTYKYTDAKPKELVQASVMFGKPVTLTKESNAIQEYAKWMTSPENPRFTTLIANRLWKKVFGLGLIEPVDEMVDATVPSNPDLMKFLTRQMIALKYDMKAYLRMVLNTQSYQRESTKEDLQPGTPYYFQGPVFRRMSAEQIWDSVVTLVNPNPDERNWTLRERERKEIDNRRQLADILDGTEPALLFDASKRVAVAMKEQNKGFAQLRKDLEEARAKDDKEKIKEIQRQLNDSQRLMRETISKCFYEAAQQSKNPALLAKLKKISNGAPMEMAMMNVMGDARVEIKDFPVDPKMKSAMAAEEKLLGIDKPKAVESYEKYRKGLHQTWTRAAELVSPAPRGHFLREFGQSDRDIVENASQEASVPQALAMLNGSLITQLNSGWSTLAMNLRKATTPEEKINSLFLSLYNRKPTAKEKALILQKLDAAAGSKTIWDDIVMAAISTQRFLFID
jgi:hypothetical protein